MEPLEQGQGPCTIVDLGTAALLVTSSMHQLWEWPAQAHFSCLHQQYHPQPQAHFHHHQQHQVKIACPNRYCLHSKATASQQLHGSNCSVLLISVHGQGAQNQLLSQRRQDTISAQNLYQSLLCCCCSSYISTHSMC